MPTKQTSKNPLKNLLKFQKTMTIQQKVCLITFIIKIIIDSLVQTYQFKKIQPFLNQLQKYFSYSRYQKKKLFFRIINCFKIKETKEYKKILSLLNEASDSRFIARDWDVFNDQSNANYNVENEII